MLEKALTGDKRYWTWIFVLLVVIGSGVGFYLRQFHQGLTITGLSRDVAWGFYIAQFTFLVGVAASAVMVVLPYYLHNHKAFGKITIMGEFLAVTAVFMCMMFIFVDMGQPFRIINVFIHPSPNSLMFWDTVALMGYLLLNIFIAWIALGAEYKSSKPPQWLKPFIIISIPWAISIHTVTAFLYSGLAARPFWLTAVLAPRFLASAFASGPALLILICLLLRKISSFKIDQKVIKTLSIIVTYAMCINVFILLMEIFTVSYSNIPEHLLHLKYMFFGLEGHNALVPWMWTSVSLAIFALVLLINPRTRISEKTLVIACLAVFISIWIDKGMGMVVAGFVPSPLGSITEYFPTIPELMISAGIYAVGLLLITIFYKIVLTVRENVA